MTVRVCVLAGDMIGGTNMTLLNRALRADAVILKPGFAAHRLDAFYHADPPGDTPQSQHHRASTGPPPSPSSSSSSSLLCSKAEVWSAPTVPARVNGTARTDRRANSMARLFPVSGEAESAASTAAGRWWYSLLLSDLQGTENLMLVRYCVLRR